MIKTRIAFALCYLALLGACNTSEFSKEGESAPLPLTKITTTTAVKKADSSVEISWTPPIGRGTNSDGSASSIESYTVRYSMKKEDLASNITENTIEKGSFTTTSTVQNLTGLRPGTIYYIAVVTKNVAGQLSPVSDPVSVKTTPVDETPPTRISAVRVVEESNNSITVGWAVPSSFGTKENTMASSFKTYIVKYSKFKDELKEEIGGANSVRGSVETTDTSLTIDGLTPSTDYYIVVFARNEELNTSPASATVTAKTTSR